MTAPVTILPPADDARTARQRVHEAAAACIPHAGQRVALLVAIDMAIRAAVREALRERHRSGGDL